MVDVSSIQVNNTLECVSEDLVDGKSTLVVAISNRPLSEPKLTQIIVATWRHYATITDCLRFL